MARTYHIVVGRPNVVTTHEVNITEVAYTSGHSRTAELTQGNQTFGVNVSDDSAGMTDEINVLKGTRREVVVNESALTSGHSSTIELLQGPPSSQPYVIYGATMRANTGETVAEKHDRYDTLLNRPILYRKFSTGKLDEWGTGSGGDADLKYIRQSRPWVKYVWQSFKGNGTDSVTGLQRWTQAEINDFVATLPSDREILLTWYHEPEDNWNTTREKQRYRALWRGFADYVHSLNLPNVKVGTILMSYTLDVESGRNWQDWYPGNGYLDFFGMDRYSRQNKTSAIPDGYEEPVDLFDPVRSAWQQTDADFWCIGETASTLAGTEGYSPADPTGIRRSEWAEEIIAYFNSYANECRFVCWWDSVVGGKDYRLSLDQYTPVVWKDACTNSRIREGIA